MNPRIAMIPACSLLLLAACSSMTIESDYDPKIDFSKYRSFQFLTEPERPSDNPLQEGSLIRNRIWDAVKRELGAKGVVFAESGSADLMVAYHVDVKEKVDVSSYGYNYGRWGARGGMYSNNVDVYRYNEGRLVLDLIDAGSRDLVWRGWATAIVGDTTDREKSTATINEAVSKILAKYPPETKTTN